MADLEEDVEDPGEFDDWEGEEEVGEANGTAAPAESPQGDRHVTPRASLAPVNGSADDGGIDLNGLERAISHITMNEPTVRLTEDVSTNPQTPERRPEPPTSSVTQPVTINIQNANEFSGLSPLYPNNHDGLTPDRVHDGPMTPRNDAGPFVLDGSAGRAAGSRLRDISPGGSDSGSTRSGAPSLPPVRFD